MFGHEVAGRGESAGGELVDQLVHFGVQRVVAAGGADPVLPRGPVLGGEVEFACDLDVQRPAPPEVVDEEIELAHRLPVLLKLDAVGAQSEVR